jgi:hypothetical protein
MLFAKKSFRQFFSSRPSRRGASYSVPAQLEILQSKVLLSAATVDPELATAEEPAATTEATATAEETATTTEELATTEEPATTTEELTPTEEPTTTTTAEDTTTGGAGTTALSSGDAWFESVEAFVMMGETMVNGTVMSMDGDYSGLTVTFSGVFSGPAVPVSTYGTFSTTFSTELSGLGTVHLMSNGVQIDSYDLYV